MRINLPISKIRIYSLISFLVPLIAINLCFLIFKLLGSIDVYPNYNWNKKETEQPISVYLTPTNDHAFTELANRRSVTFTNCPKYKSKHFFITTDNEVFLEKDDGGKLLDSLVKQKKIKSVLIKSGDELNDRCIKNSKFAYFILSKSNFLEKILLNAKEKNTSGFSDIRNPYLYGEVSISRTARYLPATLIFKPLIILSAIFLFFYWKNNLILFRNLRESSAVNNFSKNFFYFGVLSCIFLILHASFLGLDFNSKLFSQIRKVIIILFIVFEVIAQILLTKNLFTFKNELKEYISPLILKIKVLFVVIVFITTLVAFSILAFANPTTGFKHILEWNYFSFLLLYYFLSRVLWISQKNQKF